MAHAFRSAAHIEAENAQIKIDRLRERWASTKDGWYDGSVESVERRIANLDEVLATAKRIGSRLFQANVGMTCLAMLPQLRADRDELTALRDRLAGWFPGTEEEALQHNLDPRAYSGRDEWMDANNMRGYIEHSHQDNPVQGWDYQSGDHGVPPVHEDMAVGMGPLHHAAAEFLDDANTSDRTELLVRAQRLVEARTSTWSAEASTKAVRAFVAAVEDQIPAVSRTAVRREAADVDDFEDHLMFS